VGYHSGSWKLANGTARGDAVQRAPDEGQVVGDVVQHRDAEHQVVLRVVGERRFTVRVVQQPDRGVVGEPRLEVLQARTAHLGDGHLSAHAAMWSVKLPWPAPISSTRQVPPAFELLRDQQGGSGR
jgi:hypothetical protein